MHGGAITPSSAAYRGHDRRQRAAMTRRLRPADVLSFVALLLGAGVLLPVALDKIDRPTALHAQGAIRNVWALLFVGAGLLHLVRQRITGETRTGLRGIATVYLGAVVAVTGSVAPMLSNDVTESALAPMVRAVAVTGTLLLLLKAANSPPVDTSVRPIRTLATALIAGWGFIALMVVLAADHRPVDAGQHGWFGIELGLALGWLLCSLVAGTRASARRDVSLTWMTVALSLMAIADVARAFAFVGEPSWQFLATGIQLVAGVVAVTNAGADLISVLSADSARMLVLSRTVRDAERQLSADDLTERSRRHDARSVLASLKAASLVLDRYDDTLDDEARAQLLASFSTELNQLERVIGSGSQSTLQEFRLDLALAEPLIGLGAALAAPLPPVIVKGRAEEFATLVASTVTLLSRTSLDARVQVDVDRSTSGVQVICTTAGDPATARPDADDDTSARNLGLQLAKRVMREQGGDVVVNTRWDGTVSVAFWLQRSRNNGVTPEVEPAPTGPAPRPVETRSARVRRRYTPEPLR